MPSMNLKSTMDQGVIGRGPLNIDTHWPDTSQFLKDRK